MRNDELSFQIVQRIPAFGSARVDDLLSERYDVQVDGPWAEALARNSTNNLLDMLADT